MKRRRFKRYDPDYKISRTRGGGHHLCKAGQYLAFSRGMACNLFSWDSKAVLFRIAGRGQHPTTTRSEP